jgi:hypothetical protein
LALSAPLTRVGWGTHDHDDPIAGVDDFDELADTSTPARLAHERDRLLAGQAALRSWSSRVAGSSAAFAACACEVRCT